VIESWRMADGDMSGDILAAVIHLIYNGAVNSLLSGVRWSTLMWAKARLHPSLLSITGIHPKHELHRRHPHRSIRNHLTTG
jgi:hypothetical protein